MLVIPANGSKWMSGITGNIRSELEPRLEDLRDCSTGGAARGKGWAGPIEVSLTHAQPHTTNARNLWPALHCRIWGWARPRRKQRWPPSRWVSRSPHWLCHLTLDVEVERKQERNALINTCPSWMRVEQTVSRGHCIINNWRSEHFQWIFLLQQSSLL